MQGSAAAFGACPDRRGRPNPSLAGHRPGGRQQWPVNGGRGSQVRVRSGYVSVAWRCLSSPRRPPAGRDRRQHRHRLRGGPWRLGVIIRVTPSHAGVAARRGYAFDAQQLPARRPVGAAPCEAPCPNFRVAVTGCADNLETRPELRPLPEGQRCQLRWRGWHDSLAS